MIEQKKGWWGMGVNNASPHLRTQSNPTEVCRKGKKKKKESSPTSLVSAFASNRSEIPKCEQKARSVVPDSTMHTPVGAAGSLALASCSATPSEERCFREIAPSELRRKKQKITVRRWTIFLPRRHAIRSHVFKFNPK